MKYLNRIANTIGTNKSMLVIITFQKTFENHSFISMVNIFFIEPLPKLG